MPGNVRVSALYAWYVVHFYVMPHRNEIVALPQLAVSFHRNIPPEFFDEFVQAVSSRNLSLRVESREQDGPYAGLEWLIPTAVIIFIGKSYFDAFLKEMGKDHYHALKAGLNTLRAKLLGPSAPEVTVISTQGKAPADQLYSLAYSLIAEAETRLRFKLLLRCEATETEYEETIEAFLVFLEAYHERSLDPEMVEELKAARVVGGTLLLAYNNETKTLVAVDPVPSRPNNEA